MTFAPIRLKIMIFLANEYSTRDNLEAVIRAEVGDDIAKNREMEHTITGTREELKELLLDDRTTVFGVKCVITDEPTKNLRKKNFFPLPRHVVPTKSGFRYPL